jgi:hypothetical protein
LKLPVRGAEEERATFLEFGDELAREIVVGHKPAAVGFATPCGDEAGLLLDLGAGFGL